MKAMTQYVRALTAMLVLTFLQVTTYAQETTGGGTTSKTEVEITADTGNWFGDNWLWVVGVIVFIILLVALLGGGSRRRTTVIREDTGTGRVSRTTTVDDDI